MVTDCVKIKKNSLVYFKRFAFKKYNERSRENLVQNQDKKERKIIKSLKNVVEVNDINSYAKIMDDEYKKVNGFGVKYCLSVNQRKKIEEVATVFVNSVLSQFRSSMGFNQRSITFVTLTLSDKQRHTDKVITKKFIDFIDHLKKRKNYIIENGKTTKKEALPLKNYLWRSETMENGNIHFHLLFDTYFNHHTLRDVWNKYLVKLGYPASYSSASINSLKSKNDIAGYISKYLTKPPLRDKYKKYLNEDLKEIENFEKYRRPILYKQWGCSRSVSCMKYIEFQDNDLVEVEELRLMMREVKDDRLPDFISLYVGNVRSLLKKCSWRLQAIIKYYYKKIFDFYYRKVDKKEKNINFLELPLIKKYRQLEFNFI